MATTVDANRTLSLFDDLSFLQIVQINRYEVLIPATILLYDYCITFSTEINNFWSEPSFTLASFLFVSNRYFSLLLTVPVALECFAYLSEMRCRQLQLLHAGAILLLQGIVSVLLILRTYALYNRSRYILSLLLTAGLAVGAVGVWSVLNGETVHLDVGTPPLASYWHACDLFISYDEAKRYTIAYSGELAFDTLVFILTVEKTLRSDALWRRRGLFYVILRDGALFYAILTLMNAANVITMMVPKPQARGSVIQATTVMSSVLMSRLVLNLRVQGRQKSPLQSATYNDDTELSWGTAGRASLSQRDFQRDTRGVCP